ncbi:hypothetical protein EDB84DRAFT_1281500, partial [Lactarius hengduanensis]
FVQSAGLCRCFLTGRNSTLCQHCQRHYKIYKMKCEEAGVPVNHQSLQSSHRRRRRERRNRYR